MIKARLESSARSLYIPRSVGALAVAVLLMSIVGASGAWANAPGWHISQVVAPAHLAPGGKGELVVIVSNLGDANATATSAQPIEIAAQLPAGITATGVSTDFTQEQFFGYGHASAKLSCELASLSCRSEEGFVLPYQSMIALINVSIAANATSGVVKLSALGGGASPVSVEEPLGVSSAPVVFGPQIYAQVPLNEDGSIDTQAGSHPFEFTTTLDFNAALHESESSLTEGPSQFALPKELHFKEAPGLVGNPSVVPQCPLDKFQGKGGRAECPPETAVGVAQTVLSLAGTVLGGLTSQPFVTVSNVYNLTPSVGEPARFGFTVEALQTVDVFLDTSVRTGGDYGVTVSVHNISQEATFLGEELSLWGVPSDSRHDNVRDTLCLEEAENSSPCPERNAPEKAPLLTLPSSCSGASNPLTTTLEASSWSAPSSFASVTYRLHDGGGHPVGLDGCDRLPFTPSIDVAPDGQAGSAPTGLTVGVQVPQVASLNPTGLAEADVKDTTVALPAGVTLNPAAADGLQACSEAQVALSQDVFPSCLEASKVGTVEIHTPLLPNDLTGAAYLAAQNANPFGSLVALYIVAEDPISGTLIKVAGEVKPDPVTGQLVSTFKDTPQLPFEDLSLHFFGGDRAPLVTPSECGVYTTTGMLTPWSESAAASSSSTFDITSGPNGKPCQSPAPFNPTLTTGTSSIQAGGLSPFLMTMSREDGEQTLQGVTLKMPLGVSGMLSNVKLCGEEQANQGTCGPESEIGETIVSVGVGGDPYTVKGGKVYITGPYKGAPFGLSIVNPAKAGPFDLGKVIVRAKLEVNEETAAITVTTDNSGPYKIPTILDGIPLEIRHVLVDINRPGFTFNATNCSPLQITGELLSTQGETATIPVPYHVTNCAVLAFKPKLEASTAGNWTRTGGTSLNVKLTYPAGPYDANITKVKVELPKGLPSRLPTLQKACVASVFEANPAACPAASIIGHARATTPVLPVPLEGPAYFVSHGGESWPSLIIVLQGYGVTVHLVGTTLISKAGVTSSTFKTVPDVPVGTFELNLPAGPYSALTGLGNLCKQSLQMPTEFIGQNGAEIHTNTKIAATGCGKAKKTKHKTKAKHKKQHSAKGKKAGGGRKKG